jgi:hypothetical protein
MDREGAILGELFTYAAPIHGVRFEQAAFSVIANRLNMTPALADFYHRENMSAGRGFRELVGDARELPAFLAAHAALNRHYRANRFADIWLWCQSQLDDRATDGPIGRLRNAIRSHQPQDADKANTMAAVYFVYQMEKR